MLSIIEAVFKNLIFCLVFFLLLPCGSPSAWAETAAGGIVATPKLNVREKPYRNARVVDTLVRNERVRVLKILGGEGGWLLISRGQIKGYVRNRSKYISLIRKAEKKAEDVSVQPVKQVVSSPHQASVRSRGRDQKGAGGDKAREARRIRENLAVREKEVDEFTQKEVEIIEGLQELDRSLNSIRAGVASLTRETEVLGREMGKLAVEKSCLIKRIEDERHYAYARLNALYRFKMMGSFDLAAVPDSVFDFFRQQNCLERILSSDFKTLEAWDRDMEKLIALEKDLGQKQKSKKNLDSELAHEIEVMEKDVAKKNAILAEIRTKKKLGLAVLDSLKKAALRLDEEINALAAVSRSDDGGAYFHGLKGGMTMPVQGSIISRYGPARNDDADTFTFQSGIDIKVDRGEPIRSVFGGKVLYAEWLKGYGNLIIINHGDSYYTLYAYVEEFFKRKGELVDAGEVIATAGDTGSIKGTCLHFEIRHHGKPLDPLKWLKKGA